jgi:diguanylate cyclase (GGDEF)-like protein
VAPEQLSGSEERESDRHRVEEEQRWLARYAEEQNRAAEEQTASDADQTTSDADQSLSDLDGELADRDQLASERDQRAADRDQEASDRELTTHPDEASRQAHEAGLASRQAGRLERDQASGERSRTAGERVGQAVRRDENARQRDQVAEARDGVAERRDRESAALERKIAARGSSLDAALRLSAQTRTRAAEDRARAAEDRQQAALDRARAADERAEVLDELGHAHLDELTGALRRGAGDRALEVEIQRARRADGKLVLAFVDVDSLRELNNRDGHVAGDALLRNVVSAIRSNTRAYEPIVRYGGDEFICALSGVDLGQAEERFTTIRDTLATGRARGRISVGLAELRAEDRLGDLVARADTALLHARQQHPLGGD